jgi:hypothetical protein
MLDWVANIANTQWEIIGRLLFKHESKSHRFPQLIERGGSMRYRFCFALSLLLLQLLIGTSLAVTQEEISATIEARYRYTIPGFFGDFKAIGSILTVQKEGLKADRPTTQFKPNVILNSRITAVGGGSLPLGGNLDGYLKGNDRLYLYGTRSGADYIELDLFTVKSYLVTGTGTKGPTPLQASTRFRYEEGLSAVSSNQVMKDITQWLKTEDEARNVSDGKATRTIQLGQTEDEVISIFGTPEKKILLGSKSVFIYRDVKVVFIDGKVADAE